MIKILQYILKKLAQMTIWRYQPEIVAVTGSVGKSATKEAIYYVLQKKFKVRRNIRNYNNELGVPLTVLGQDICPSTKIQGVPRWFWIILKAIVGLVYYPNYPKILILELGVGKPNDMAYLKSFVPIKVAVLTRIGMYPAHLEFFTNRDDLAAEKAGILKGMPKDGLVVLNVDDDLIVKMKESAPKKVPVITYGFSDGADLRIHNYELRVTDLARFNFGVNFKIDHGGSNIPFRLKRVLGRPHVYAISAATAVGLYYGLNMVEISSMVKKYRTLPGRTKLVRGIKNTWIIDDSYNASPTSTLAALDVLREMPTTERRIAVLGDMLELGVNTEKGHREVGESVSQGIDLFIAVGDKSIFTVDEAKKFMDHNKIYHFDNADKARLKVQEMLKQGDIILIKGSRGIHMEQITKEIMAYPEKADQLLVH